MKDVWISVNNQKTKGTLFYPEKFNPPAGGKNPAVLFIHGWTSDESGYKPRAEALTKLGFICLTIDLRGHGQSSGELKDFSRKDHLEDVKAAYDFLASQPYVDSGKIGVVGASYGGYLASLLTSYRKIIWLVMRAPALFKNQDFDKPSIDIIKDEIECFQQLENTNIEDNYALSAVNKFDGNILIIESENDKIIPHAIIENYINTVKDKNKLTHKVIKGAEHNLSTPEWKQEFIDILTSWFKKETLSFLAHSTGSVS